MSCDKSQGDSEKQMIASTALVRVPVRNEMRAGWAALRRRMFEAAMDVAAGEVRVWMEALEGRRMLSAATPAFEKQGASVAWLPSRFNVPGFQAEVWPTTVINDSNGGLLVAGELGRIPDTTRVETWREWFIARVNPDGTPDQAFGQVGGFEVLRAAKNVSNVSVLPLAGGKFIIVGSSDEDVFVARFEADGSIDPTYNGGITNFNMFLGDVFAQVAPDGSVTVTGLVSADLAWDSGDSLNAMVTLRLTPDGRPDLGFAPGGHVTADLPADRLFDDDKPTLISATAIRDGGVSIYYEDWSPNSYLRDDHPDLTFTLRHVQLDARGTIVSANQIFPELPSERADGSGAGYGVLALPDGSAYVGGGIDGNRIEKLNAADQPDPTFGEKGVATVPFQDAATQDIDTSGKLILNTYDTTTFTSTFVRLNRDGSVDSTFQPWSPQTTIYGTDLILPDGELVVVNEISPFDSTAAGFAIYTRPSNQPGGEAGGGPDSLAGDPAVMSAFAQLQASAKGPSSLFATGGSPFGDNGSNLFGDDSVAN